MPDDRDDPRADWLPELAALLAMIIWGVSFVATKAALHELEPLPLVVLRFGLGVTFLLAISGSTWGALAFLGIGSSGIGYLLWYGALERIDASRVSAFLYVEPLATLAAAQATLGEPLELTTMLGGLVVLAGVGIVQRAT